MPNNQLVNSKPVTFAEICNEISKGITVSTSPEGYYQYKVEKTLATRLMIMDAIPELPTVLAPLMTDYLEEDKAEQGAALQLQLANIINGFMGLYGERIDKLDHDGAKAFLGSLYNYFDNNVNSSIRDNTFIFYRISTECLFRVAQNPKFKTEELFNTDIKNKAALLEMLEMAKNAMQVHENSNPKIYPFFKGSYFKGYRANGSEIYPMLEATKDYLVTILDHSTSEAVYLNPKKNSYLISVAFQAQNLMRQVNDQFFDFSHKDRLQCLRILSKTLNLLTLDPTSKEHQDCRVAYDALANQLIQNRIWKRIANQMKIILGYIVQGFIYVKENIKDRDACVEENNFLRKAKREKQWLQASTGLFGEMKTASEQAKMHEDSAKRKDNILRHIS